MRCGQKAVKIPRGILTTRNCNFAVQFAQPWVTTTMTRTRSGLDLLSPRHLLHQRRDQLKKVITKRAGVLPKQACLENNLTHNPELDAEMARKLQEQMDMEDTKQELEDLEAARKLQAEEADAKRLEDDAKFAKELYLSEKASDPGRVGGGGGGGGGGGRRADPSNDSTHCATCGKSMHLVRSSLNALGQSYCNNDSCFSCALCAEAINDGSFQVFEGSPVHSSCFTAHVVPSCVVCDCKVPTNSQGHYSYNKHPFFQNWKYCASHEDSRRCTSCNR